MDNSPNPVDKWLEIVDELVDNFRVDSGLWHTLARLDTTPILTRSVWSEPRPSEAVRGSVPPRSLTEFELLRGYGLDPTDIERELIARCGYELGPG